MKKGFTLVEIILSIGLIVLIGTVSIVSFNVIKKNNKITSLNNMSEEIYNAVNLYVATNSEVKNEMYKNNNGIKIPLTTLENAGLVDFQDIDIDEEDYVVTMLGSTESDDDHCASTYTAKSWNITSGETIYICEKANGSQNLVTVAGDADSLSKATRETFYFRGAMPQNYIQLNGTGTKYRIISIERDDSLILYSSESFGTVFDGYTQPISYSSSTNKTAVLECIDNKIHLSETLSSANSGIASIGIVDTINSSICSENNSPSTSSLAYNQRLRNLINTSSWIGTITMYNYAETVQMYDITYRINTQSGYKIHLKSCMKITGGTGDIATPYILKNQC